MSLYLIDDLKTITPTKPYEFTTNEIIVIVIVIPVGIVSIVVVSIIGKDIFYINIIFNILSVFVVVVKKKKRCPEKCKSIHIDIFTSHENVLVNPNNHTSDQSKEIEVLYNNG